MDRGRAGGSATNRIDVDYDRVWRARDGQARCLSLTNSPRVGPSIRPTQGMRLRFYSLASSDRKSSNARFPANFAADSD